MFSSIALHYCMCLCIYVVADFVWSQEEHRNMGAWSFVAPRFENILGKKVHVLILAGPVFFRYTVWKQLWFMTTFKGLISKWFASDMNIYYLKKNQYSMKSCFIQQLRYVGRDHLGTPATGVGQIHQAEAKLLLQQTFNWWPSVCLSLCHKDGSDLQSRGYCTSRHLKVMAGLSVAQLKHSWI